MKEDINPYYWTINIDNVKMNKQEATQKIEVLEKELADLKKIVNSPEERFNMALDQVHASVACSFVGFEQVMRTLRKRFYKK